jgi:SOS-response transcriptional repressor LexA
MNKDISDFKRLIKEDHQTFGSFKKLAKASGIGATTLQHWEADIKIAPDFANLASYVRTIPVPPERKALYFRACGCPVPEEYKVPHGEVSLHGPASDLTMIPLVGDVHAGCLNYAAEDIEDYIPTMNIPGVDQSALVWLRIEGDCMNEAGLPEGSLALVEIGSFPRSGGVAVFYNTDEFVVRKYIENEKSKLLMPVSSNPAHVPIVIDSEDWRCYGVVLQALVRFQ